MAARAVDPDDSMFDEPPLTDKSRPTRFLLQIAGRPCAGCAGKATAYEAVWSIALGFKDAPRCLPCLSLGLDRNMADLQRQLDSYIRRNECFRLAWHEAMQLEGEGTPLYIDQTMPEAAWNAGELSCGELILALRARVNGMPPNAVLAVKATDPSAKDDIPSWCRLTGHELVSANSPIYYIRRKGA